MSKSLDCVLAVPKESCHRRFSPVVTSLLFKTSQKCFFLCYHLQCSFKIFITVFTFLYMKANSEEMFFTYFFRKMLMSAFLLRLKANYLEKMRGYPFSFLDSNSFCKDLLFAHGPNLEQKPPYLVGTFLNTGFCISLPCRPNTTVSLKTKSFNAYVSLWRTEGPGCSPI